MDVSFQLEGDKLTVRLRGEIDHHTSSSLREQIDGEVMRTAAMELILDFSGVTFMDSSGIGLILGRYRWMQSTGGSVRITHIAPYLEQLLLLSNIHRLVSVEVEKPEEHIVEETGRDIYSDSSKEVRYDAK